MAGLSPPTAFHQTHFAAMAGWCHTYLYCYIYHALLSQGKFQVSLPQVWQVWGLSPVWQVLCFCNFLCILKDLPHWSQVNSLSVECVFLCAFKLLQLLKPVVKKKRVSLVVKEMKCTVANIDICGQKYFFFSSTEKAKFKKFQSKHFSNYQFIYFYLTLGQITIVAWYLLLFKHSFKVL